MKPHDERDERRFAMRFDKAFPVMVSSDLLGDLPGIARNISTGGMMVEMLDPLPLGSVVTVVFPIPDSQGEVSVKAEVKHQYCLNFAVGDQPSRAQGIGLRFVEFSDETLDQWNETFARHRVLH